MKNKKGFTLVELLAVIVILALIMGIAVVSIGSVITSSKESAFRETAANILNGVKQRLYINTLGDGYYTFPATILERGGTTSAYGGNILYNSSCTDEQGVCKSNSDLECNESTGSSFVKVDGNEYKICLIDSNKYRVYATEAELLRQKAEGSTPAPIITP